MAMRRHDEIDRLIDTYDRSDVARLRSVGADGLVIEADYEGRSLFETPAGAVEEREARMPVRIEMHPDHPRVPPVALALHPELFNPHVHSARHPVAQLAPVPFICAGEFTPHTRLCDWAFVIWEIFRWARLSTQVTLNPAATAFARRESASGRFPIDPRPFFVDEPALAAAPAGAAAPVAAGGLRLGAWRAE